MPFNCDECKKEMMLLHSLSSYGQTAKGVKDDGEYCQLCFELKFEERDNDKNNKE